MNHASGYRDNNPDDGADANVTGYVIFLGGFIAGMVTVWGFFELTGF